MKILHNIFFKQTFFLLFILLLVISCKEPASDTIRIGVLDGPSAISFIRLIDKPLIINGKKTEVIIKSDPQQIQALMMQKKLDFAILPTVMSANLFNKGIPYKIVAIPVWGTLYLVTSDHEISSPENLAGKQISVFGQSATPDILLQSFIKYYQLKNVKIDYSFGGNHELANALMQKKVRTAVLSEPLVSNILHLDSTFRIVTKLNCEYLFNNTNTNIFAQTSFLVSDKFISDYQAQIHIISDAYSNSCKFVNEHPDEAVKLCIKHHLLSNQVDARRVIQLCSIRYIGAFAVEPELMRYLSVIYNYNPSLIGGKMPDRDIIYQP